MYRLKWAHLALVLSGFWSTLGVAAESSEPAAPGASQPGPAQPGRQAIPPGQQPPQSEQVEERTGAEREGVPSLQMSSDFGAPALSIGAYRPVGQVDSRGMHVAPFTIRAALNTAMGFDSNVALRDTNKISSPFFTVNPSIAAGLEGATQRYYAIYRGNYGRYSSSTVDDYDDHNLTLTAANAWTTRVRSLLTYDYLRGHTPRGAVGTTTVEPDRWNWHSLRGTASYGADGAPARIEGNFGLHGRHYLTNRSVNAFADYDQVDVGGGFSYRLAPKTRGLIQVTHSDISHPSDRTLDSTEVRYLAGVTWNALAATQGTIRAGYMTKDFSTAGRSNFSGGSFEGSVTWLPLTYSVVELGARRTLAESLEGGSSFVVNNAGSLSWNHAWIAGIRSSLSYIFGRLNYQDTGQIDKYQNFAVRASYGLQRWLRVGAEIRHDTRDSNRLGFDYKRNLTLLTLEAAL